MKILIHAVSAKSGGAETQVRNLVGELARMGKGHRYLLCVPPRLAAELRERWDHVTVIETDAAFKSAWRRLLWDQWAFRRLAREADRILVISDFGLLFPPCPQVLTLQNSLFFSTLYAEKILPSKSRSYRLQLLLRRWLVSLLIRHSAIITTASQSMLDEVRRLIPIPDAKTAVNPFGVPAGKFRHAGQAVQGASLRLLYVSEYGDYKNLSVVLKAIALLHEMDVPGLCLTATLDPSQFPDVELATRDTDRRLLADPRICPHIRNVGFIPYAEIQRFYQESDIFVFSSIAESFGHPLVEAMASGLPIVASDIPICREICGEAALYFDPMDPQELAQKILLLWKDGRMRRRLGKIGEARAQSRFTWKGHATRLLRILEEDPGGESSRMKKLLFQLAVTVDQPQEELAKALIRRPGFDWNALYGLADRHQMVGILAPRLLQALDGSAPVEARAPWIARWRALAMRDLAQRAALERILVAAQSKGIHPMLLKGIAVQTQAYPEDSARGAFDIDLLVQPPDLPGMVHCLEESGYLFVGKDARGRPMRWPDFLKRTHEAPFHRSADGISVELHGSLCSPLEERLVGLTLRDRLWGNPRRIPLGQTSYLIPGREEELLFLCLHLLKAGPFFLRGLADLALLLEISPSVDWPRFLQLARLTGTGTVAYYALEMVSQIRSSAVPDSARATLARYSGPRWLLSSSVQLDRLLENHGEDWTNWGLHWRGIFFAQRPWVWLPYQAALRGKSALRRIGLY